MKMTDKIELAVEFSTNAHKGQKRKFSNLDYVSHPIFVAELVSVLKESKNSEVLIISAILHDTVEDCNISLSEIAEKFGYKVASIVEELTSDSEEIKKLSKRVYLSEKMICMSTYALVVKLIDRFHNLSDLKKGSSFTSKYVSETEFVLEQLKRRKLTKTHIKIIDLINKRILELK